MPQFTPITYFDTPPNQAYPVATPLDSKLNSKCFAAYDQFVQNPDFKRFLAFLRRDNQPEFGGINPDLPESYIVTFTQERRNPGHARVNVKQDPASLGRDFPLDQDNPLNRLALSVIDDEEPKAASPQLFEATTQTTPSPVPSIPEHRPVNNFRPIHPAPYSPQLDRDTQSPINISPQEEDTPPIQLPAINIHNPAPQQQNDRWFDLVAGIGTQHAEQLKVLQTGNDNAIAAIQTLAQNQREDAAATQALLLGQIEGLRGDLANANAARTEDRNSYLAHSAGFLAALEAERQTAAARQTELITDRDMERQAATAEHTALLQQTQALFQQIAELRQEIRDLANQAAAPIILPPFNLNPPQQPAPAPQLLPPPPPAPQAAAPPPAIQQPPAVVPPPPHAPPAPAPAPQAAAPPPVQDGQPDPAAQLARLRTLHEAATAERDALRDLLLEARDRNNVLLRRNHALEPLTEQARLTTEQLAARGQELRQQANALAEHAATNARQEQELRAAREAREQLEVEREQLRQQAAALGEHPATIARQELELRASRAAREQLEAERTHVAEQLRTRTEQLQQQQVETTDLRLRLGIIEQERNSYQQQLDANEREHQDLRAQIINLGRRAAEAEAQTGQLQVSVRASDALRQQLEESQARFQQLGRERDALIVAHQATLQRQRLEALAREHELQQRIQEIQQLPVAALAPPPAPVVQLQPPQPVPAPQVHPAVPVQIILSPIFMRPPAQPLSVNALVAQLFQESQARQAIEQELRRSREQTVQSRLNLIGNLGGRVARITSADAEVPEASSAAAPVLTPPPRASQPLRSQFNLPPRYGVRTRQLSLGIDNRTPNAAFRFLGRTTAPAQRPAPRQSPAPQSPSGIDKFADGSLFGDS